MPQTAEAFLDQQAPDAESFLDDAPSAEKFIEESVSRMASATRATVSVVGRAIAAHDFAVAGYDAPDRSRLSVPEPDEAALQPIPGDVAPIAARRESIEAAADNPLLKPLIPWPRADLGIFGPSQANVPEGVKVAAGVYNAAKALPEFFSSPVGIALLASGNLPAIAQRLIAAGFTVDLAIHTPAQIKALATAIQSGDTQEISETATALGLNVAMTGLSAKHALTNPKPKTPLEQVAPLTADAVAKAVPKFDVSIDPRTGKAALEPTPEFKPGDAFQPEDIPISTTPLTTEAVAKVVEKEPVPPPAPTPAAVASESGRTQDQAVTRTVGISRLNALKPRIQQLVEKGGLTALEADEFRTLNAEANSIRFDLAKPLDESKIPSETERQSTLPKEVVISARNDLMANKDIYTAIVDAAIGVSHNADTAIDNVMNGRNPKVSAQQFYDAFNTTRNALRDKFGDTIELFRAQGNQRKKPTQNWATTKEYAQQFGDKIDKATVPISDIIAVNVGPSGKYHEVIVGKKPSVTEGVEPPAKASVTPDVTVAKPEGERTLTTEGDPSLTGIKNAKVDGERQSRGQEPILEPERLSNQTVWDRVMARIEAEPRWQDALIEELKTKPRTPSQDEILALDHRYVELKNGYDKAVAEGIKANEAGNPELAEAASRDAAIHEKWLGELEQVARNVGTEWGRSGQMRQRLLREDFTLAAMEAGARAKKGFEPLTPEEHSYFKELSEKHEAAEKKAAELEAAATEAAAALEAQKALTEAAKAAVPEYPPSVLAHAQRFVDFMHTKGDAARARIRERMARTYAAVDPTVLADAAIIGAEHLSAKALDVAKFTEAMVRDVGEWVREHAQEIFDASKKALTESENSFFKSADETTKKRVKKAAQTPTPTDARTSATEGLKESVAEGADGAEIGKYARAIAETFIKDGIRELEPLTDAVHGVLKTVLPEITRTESRDAWTNYGKYKLLDKDAVKVRLRELSTEGQKVSTIERLENKQPGLKTGTERQPPTDSARRMQKRINELKKELGIVTTDPSTQLRSALDAIKTRNQNRIKDLRFENSTRTRIVRGKRVAPSDAEMVAQRAEIDRLKKENEEIFGSKELTDEQRLQRAIAASERAEIAAEDRLARAENGDFSKVAGNPIPESGTLNEIRARTAALREETARLKDLATPKKTPDEIAIQSLKTRMASEKADLTRRLAEADFSPRRNPPRELTLDTPTAAARAEVLKLREEFRQRLAQYEYEQKSRMDKIWQGVKSARGAFVNIASSFDFSAPRQALLAILGNTTRLLTSPKRGAEMLARPFARMFESWSSERRAGIIEEKIKARPNAKNGADKIAEIHYSEINSTKFTRYEENAHSILDEWARLPLKTGNLAKTVTTAPLKLGARGVRASNRAFITFLNSTRAELFDELLRVNFNDRAPTSAELKVIGNMVNVATGRGKLGPRTTAAASSVIWAPSLLASRVQALTGQPLLTGQWAGSGRARLIVAKEYARWIAGGYLLWAVSRLFDDKDETKPTSSDFGKIVRGNTRIDPWGGLQQVTTLGARTATATTTSLRGKESDIGAARKYGQRGLWHVWADFGRSKLRPDIGVAIDIGTRATFRGEPTTPGHVAKSLLVPLPMREIVGILKDRGFTEGMIVEALGLFGAGVSNYEDSEAQK